MGCNASAPSTVSTRRFKDKYALGRVIGEGTMGKVHAATVVSANSNPDIQRSSSRNSWWTKKQEPVSDDKLFAVKCIKAASPTDARSRSGLAELDKMVNQIQMWKDAGQSEHCVKLLEVFLNQDEKKGKKHYFVMEKCDYNLREGLDRICVSTTEQQRAAILKQTLLAVAHLHAKLIMHRDVNADNILLASDGAVKLGGFGCATPFPEPRLGLLKDRAGSLQYMSPEMIELRGYAKETDVWSLGVAAYLLAYGALPYPNGYRLADCSGRGRLKFQVNLGMLREDCTSNLMKSFVQTLLDDCEYTRSSANKALQSPMMQMDPRVHNLASI